jgi:hypothetical protein
MCLLFVISMALSNNNAAAAKSLFAEMAGRDNVRAATWTIKCNTGVYYP